MEYLARPEERKEGAHLTLVGYLACKSSHLHPLALAARVTFPVSPTQPAATIMAENVIKKFARMPARNRRNAVWFINQAVETQLYQMSLSIGTGGAAYFLPGGGLSEAPYSTLFGRPVIPIEQCAGLGSVGDIILADMSSYLLAEKGGIKSDVSIHVKFAYDESVFRFVYRVDGQPILASPITPFKGSDPVGPFVALGAR